MSLISFTTPHPEGGLQAWNVNDNHMPLNLANVATNWSAWGLEPDGSIMFAYSLGDTHRTDVFVKYDPNTMPTVAHILGAIRTYYFSPMTRETAQELYKTEVRGGQISKTVAAFLEGRAAAPANGIAMTDSFESIERPDNGTYSIL